MTARLTPSIDASTWTEECVSAVLPGEVVSDDASVTQYEGETAPTAPAEVEYVSDCDVETQREIGRAMLESHQLYRPGECAKNVRCFLGTHWKMPWLDRLSLMVIVHQDKKEMEDFYDRSLDLTPHAALFTLDWMHHVILEFGGRVYDFEYIGEPGTPLPLYAEEMFAGGISCFDAVVMPISVMMKRSRRLPLIEHLFSGKYRRISVSELVERSAQRYGTMKLLGLERRDRNYHKWGLMYEDSAFKFMTEQVRSAQFDIRYEAGKAFTLDAFEALLMKTLAETKHERPNVDRGFINVMFQGKASICEEDLRALVERVVRPMGINGPITFEFSSVLHPFPRMVVID